MYYAPQLNNLDKQIARLSAKLARLRVLRKAAIAERRAGLAAEREAAREQEARHE